VYTSTNNKRITKETNYQGGSSKLKMVFPVSEPINGIYITR